MKTYKVRKTYYQFYYAEVKANSYEEAKAKAQSLEIDDCKEDEYAEWELYSIDALEKV